jgi:HSP20 family protein
MTPVVRRTNWLPGILNDFFGNEWVERQTVASPAVNVIENDRSYQVEIATPGLTKEDLRVDVHEDNRLVVSVEKKTETKEEDKGNKYLRHEFTRSSFRQVMVLPENVNTESIHAKVEDGVLHIDIPKVVKETKTPPVRSVNIQ